MPTANGTSRLDVASPGVNFLMKSDTVVLIMTGSPTRAIHVRQKPCTHGLADADIVSAFPLSFSTFLENINILRQTSSTWHRILWEFCVLEYKVPVLYLQFS